AARELGLVLRTFEVRKLEEIEPAFDAMVSASMQAVTPGQGGVFFQARALMPKLALARGLPMLAYSRGTFPHRPPVSYADAQMRRCRRSAVYAEKIVKGANPGASRGEQPTKFELVINRKTANALGLTVPPTLIATADEVIE